MLNLLITIKNTYEEKIINYMFKHAEEKIISCNEFQKLIEDHTTQKMMKEYESKIEILSRNLSVCEEKVDLLTKIGKKIVRSVETHIKYVDTAFEDYNKILKKKHGIELKAPKKVIEYVDTLNNNCTELKLQLGVKKTNEKKTFTLNTKEKNKSIVKELPDLGIKFTGSNEDIIPYKEFKAYCETKGVPSSIVNDLIKTLNDDSSTNTDSVERIIFTDPDKIKAKYNNELDSESDTESDTESNTESNTESDIESDIESDTKSYTKSDTKSYTKSEIKSLPESDVESVIISNFNSESDTDTDINSDSQSKNSKYNSVETIPNKIVTKIIKKSKKLIIKKDSDNSDDSDDSDNSDNSDDSDDFNVLYSVKANK